MVGVADSDCRKTPGELERVATLSNFQSRQRRVRWARDDFCAGKSHFPEQKSFPCSFCARKSLRFQQKLVRVAVAGELASPSTSLSKPFLTSWQDCRALCPAVLSDCQKTPGELERAAALSNFQSCPAACTVGTGRFLRRKIPFSREKIVSLQAPRPKNLRFLAETGEGGRKAENPLGFQVSPLAKLPTAQIVDLRRGTWPGSLLPRPPACQNFFDKLAGAAQLRRRF